MRVSPSLNRGPSFETRAGALLRMRSSNVAARRQPLMVRSTAVPCGSNHEARTIERILSNRLSGIRHRCGEAAVDREGLAVDIGGLVAGEEQAHRCDLVRLAG